MADIKFLGLKLPKALDDCLRLQSVLQAKGRSELVRDMIQLHASDNDWSVGNLTDRYAKHIYSQWDLRFRESASFQDYLADRRLEMVEKHNLPVELIKIIVEKCNEEHRLNQSANR